MKSALIPILWVAEGRRSYDGAGKWVAEGKWPSTSGLLHKYRLSSRKGVLERGLHFFALLLFVMALSACNLREDALLPPGLDPATYSTSAVIESYRDHLISSSNDNGYLFIRKEMIGSGGFNYGDRIIFQRVTPLTQRDSLALPAMASDLTGTYSFQVIRQGIPVSLTGISGLAEVFTDRQNTQHQRHWLISNGSWLLGSSIQPVTYHQTRIRFGLDATGEFCLLSTPEVTELSIGSKASGTVRQGWFCSESRGFGIQFKDTYLASAGSVRITATMDLTPAEIGLLQSIFPGFATNSPAVRVQTTGNVSSGAYATDRRCWGAEGERPYDWISGAYALIRTDLPARRVFQQQWTRVSATDVFGWQEGANTWQIVDGELFSFFQGSGTYVLGTPLSGQDSVTIPLDAGLEKVFIQSVWLDFRSINLPDWSVRIELNPQLSTLLTDYFNGTPYQISGYTAYAIRFLHQGQEMESLPANQWIESGLATTHTINPASRLFRCYRTAELDHISYKTSAGAYDADHFSSGDGYIYSGISYSGIYLLADDTGNQTQIRIPYLKSNCRIQTGNAEVSWNDPVRRDYTELSINLAPATDLTHPWFNGSPFHLSNVMPLARVDMFSRKTRSDLPAEFHIRLRNTVLDRKIVTFDNARGPAVLMQRSGFPRLKLYATDALSDDNQFQTDDQWVSFYPEFGGDYFAATLTTDEAGRFPLAYYSTMAFNTNDFKVFTDSDATIPPNSIMTVELHDALPDQYSILANQYDLAQASRAIYFSFNDSSLLATVTPRIYWHTTGRAARLLFSESTGVPYRIYPYTDATDLNDWNYTIDRGYVSFLLTMAGAYAMLDDNAPHTQIMAAVMALFIPFHLSLYQSQMTVQQSFIPSALPLGSQVILARVATVPNLPEALYGYRIIFRNPQGNPFNPAFIDNFASDQYPFIYVPIDDPTLIPTARLFFRPVAGADIELTRVQSFSDYFRHEYMIIGNCALCFVNEPGLFIVRQ